MRTRLIVAALALTVGMAGGARATAQGKADAHKYEKGAYVTLRGCVTAAEKKDTFVLTNVQEWPAAASANGKYGPRFYWINKGSKDLVKLFGRMVQFSGKITEVKKSEIELKPGDADQGSIVKVEVEGPGKDVVTSPANANVRVPNHPDPEDIKITLLKLDIEGFTRVEGSCPISSTRQ